MKKFYSSLLLIFAVAFCNAQIVNIPDANFKAKLLAASPTSNIAFNANGTSIKIDTNNDGQIQQSEAQTVYKLSVIGYNIADLTGIQSFSNLRDLNCLNNQLTNLNVSGLVNLVEVRCSTNHIGNLNLNNLPNLERFYCNDNVVTSLNINNLSSIHTLDCTDNQLTVLDLSVGLASLEYLYCRNNMISNLNLTGLVNLKYMTCANNSISSLNLNGLVGLTSVYASHNLLTNLSMNGLVLLSVLECQYNQLSTINISGLNNLYRFICSYNNLSAIDLSVRPNYYIQVDCSYNPNMLSINAKDNKIMTAYAFKQNNFVAFPPPPDVNRSDIDFRGTPNLQYFCADAGEMAYVQNKINTSGYTNPNCQLSSTCDFTAPTTNTTTASACGNYTWVYNNQNYTASGTYTIVTGSHTEILNLTITPVTSNTTTVAACGSYTWPYNNQVYTASGTYSVVTGCHTENLNLTINNSLITAQPTNPTLCTTVGSTADVAVVSTIASPTYTWQYRVITSTQPNPAWITITGANASTVYSGYTSAVLHITKTATLPKTGTQYRVVVSGGECGSVTSDTANLTILGVVKAGAITSSASVCAGNYITFTLSGNVGSAVQWQSAPNAAGTFTNIPGASITSYTAANMQPDSNKAYRVLVTNGPCGTTATTAVKTIKVDALPVAGTVTGGGIICSGSSATLKVMGYVGKIQWEYATDGVNYANAPKAADAQTIPFGTTSTNSTAATYMITGMAANVYFRAKVTNGACSAVYTNVVHYTLATIAIAGTASAANDTVCPGTATTLILSEATGTITWQKSTNYTSVTPTWAAIANSNVLTLSTGNLVYKTAYRAMVTIGSCSTVYSNITYINLIAKPVARAITSNVTSPSGNTALTALCITDVSKVLTAGPYVGLLQWQKSTVSTTSGFVDIPGATVASYTVINPIAGANYYRVKIYNVCGLEVFSKAVAVYYQNCSSGKSIFSTVFDVKGYPNPYTQNFYLSITTSNTAMVHVSIYDLTGRQVEKMEVVPGSISELQIGKNYPSGIYNIVVIQEKELKTIRMIKQ